MKLGDEWVRRDGLQEPGFQYHINKLPEGYAIFITASGDQKQQYKRLFGHPSGRFYDSIPTFTPHFLWLQDGMTGDCACKLCDGRVSATTMPTARTRKPRNALDPLNILPSRLIREAPVRQTDSSTRESSATGIASGRARRDVKQSGAPYARDEEGTEDVYKLFIKRLEAAKNSARGVEEDITEINSFDWRAEHQHGDYGEEDLLPTQITRIEQQHSFIPRIGELVLWCPNFLDQHYLMLDKTTSEFKFYSFEDRHFHGHPAWRAGVVTAVPTSTTQNGPVDFPDILDTPEKKTALNTAGFRVETIPDPNDPLSKYMSKQYKFVPLRSIRPLSQWHSVLEGIPEKKLHPSIKNAFTCMTTISLVEKFKAVGRWPAASIFCKGLYLGSEFIIVGDTIRLTSEESPKKCTDVLHVDSIRLNLEDMEPEHTLPQSPYLCGKSSITLVGTAYTLDRSRCYVKPANETLGDGVEQIHMPTPVPQETIRTMFRPVGSGEYGAWYPLHDEKKKYEVSSDQVLGRLYEAEAVRLWTGQRQERTRQGQPKQLPRLDFDVSGIISARYYATMADERLPEPVGNEISWFWADTRVQALDVATFNGVEVGKYDDVRDPDTLHGWQEGLKILNGVHTTPSEIMNFTSIFPGGSRGRKPGSKLVNGRIVMPGDPDYPGGPGDEDATQKPKASSQMAGAALASTDEGSTDGDDDDDVEIVAGMVSRDDDKDMLAKFTARPAPQPAKKPLTKEQIMSSAVVSSVEGGQEFDDDVSSEEEPWWELPPPVRGGTEESEGGDYNPSQPSATKDILFGASKKRMRFNDDFDEA